MSRISRGKIVLRKERIALTTVVNHALEVCEQMVRQQDHELIVTLPEHPVYVDADKTRFDFTHDRPLSEEEVADTP